MNKEIKKQIEKVHYFLNIEISKRFIAQKKLYIAVESILS